MRIPAGNQLLDVRQVIERRLAVRMFDNPRSQPIEWNLPGLLDVLLGLISVTFLQVHGCQPQLLRCLFLPGADLGQVVQSLAQIV